MDNEKEKALAQLLIINTRLVKETNSPRGESKKTIREYAKALGKVCSMMDIDPEVVDDIVEPKEVK